MRILSLFAGIGSFEKALKNLGIPCEIVAFSEIDKYAVQSYCAVHNVDSSLNLGDISKIDVKKLPKDIDIVTHGSPCQDFSVAGKNQGGDKGSKTRSSLMWCTVDIVEEVKPKIVLWENVKNVISKKHRHNFDAYVEVMDNLGYNSYYEVLNAKDFGVPQNRERVFTVSIRKDIDNKKFKFPQGFPLTKKLKDVLEKNVDEKYYLSDEYLQRFIVSTGKNGKNGKNKYPFGKSTTVLGSTVTETAKGPNIRHFVYDTNNSAPTLLATDYKQPKQILEEKPILVGGFGEKNFGSQYRQGNRVYDSEGIGMCLTSQPVGNLGGNSYLYKVDEPSYDKPVRLGGVFDDEKGKHQAGSIWDTESISPTLDTMQGGWRQPCVITEGNVSSQAGKVISDEGLSMTTPKMIKYEVPEMVKVRKYEVDVENLKKDLKLHKRKLKITISQLAEKLDVEKTTVEHWFRNDSSFSIPTPDIWMKLKDILEITTDQYDKSIMTFIEKENTYEKSNRVYDSEGITATITTDPNMKILECEELPVIVASRGRNPKNPSDRSKGTHLEQTLEVNKQGICNTLTSVQKDNYVIEDSFVSKKYKEFYAENGYIPDKFNPYNKSEIKDVAPTQTTNCSNTTSSACVLVKEATKKGYKEAYEGDSINITYPSSKTKRGRVGDQIAQTLDTGSGLAVVESIPNFRIRKLTPTECWLLMGFTKDDIEKAINIGISNTQLYKQAGNSIVVDVLEHIFKNIFNENGELSV